jgi:hypothetical protein
VESIVGGGMLQILGLGLFLHDVVSYQARRQPVTRGERRALLTA